jgi:hypothetical protein
MKIIIAILSILLIATNGYWLYSTIDFGISYTYLESSMDLTAKALEQTMIVANHNVIGMPLEEAQIKFKTDVYGLEPFIKEGCLYVGQVCLELNDKNIITEVTTGAP